MQVVPQLSIAPFVSRHHLVDSRKSGWVEVRVELDQASPKLSLMWRQVKRRFMSNYRRR